MQFIGKFAFVAIVLTCSAAFAQRGAASKAAGDYNFYSNGAATSVNHAIDYAVDYQQYVQNTPKSEQTQENVFDQTGAITGSLARAKKHFNELRKTTTDPDKLATLDKIDEHMRTAIQSHNEMMSQDRDNTDECVGRTIEALQNVQNEHQNLTGDNTPENTK